MDRWIGREIVLMSEVYNSSDDNGGIPLLPVIEGRMVAEGMVGLSPKKPRIE